MITPNSSSPFAPAPESRRPQRVVVIDDHPLTRRGLLTLVAGLPGIEICGEGGTGAEARELVAAQQPDVLLLDISLPDANGIELTKTLRAQPHPPRIVIISMHDDTMYAEWALRAGACGYIRKDESRATLAAALERTLRGEIYVSPKIQEKIFAVGNRGLSVARSFGVDRLSERETEVLHRLGTGKSAQQIAAELGISIKTVDTFRDHLKTKLGLKSSSDLTRYSINWKQGTTWTGSPFASSPRSADASLTEAPAVAQPSPLPLTGESNRAA